MTLKEQKFTCTLCPAEYKNMLDLLAYSHIHQKPWVKL